MFRRTVPIVFLISVVLLPSRETAAWAADPKQPGHYLHVRRGKDGASLALESAIVRYAPQDGRRSPTVDLVAAVHVGDKSYYAQLNRQFATYDAVLYELVAPESANVPRPTDPDSKHPLAVLQNGLKDLLGLEFQLKQIDYRRPNMVHADMSPDEFAASMEKRGEGVTTLLIRMLTYAITQQNRSDDGASVEQLIWALFDKDRALSLKRILAEEFINSEGSFAALDGPAGSTLISGRNELALQVLRRQIAAGKQSLAIFYGAAHMPNFDKRLRDDFGMKPIETHWLPAWKLTP
jgi:hypothetical protein